MATITIKADSERVGRWWLVWSERDELIGRIDQSPGGLYRITPQGSHWSPMKSFGQAFASCQQAHREVELYFARR